ncbi:MAG TPA: MG2 domain-containing protein, partial [Blastocatellia bacterium]|nr:MG2 domain-containing protein [Blastocatellia bacterium]
MRLNVNSRSMKRHLSKRGLLRNQGLRTALILIVGAGAIFTYTRVQNTWVFASEKDLAAVYRDGVVEVNIPYDEGTARAGSLKVEILDPADKVIGSVQKSATATHARPWRVSIPIFPLVAIEDLAWDRLRITSGDASRTVSLSEILSLPVVRIFAQRSYAAGSTVALRVITTESKAGTPLPNSKIKIELTEGGRSATLFTGRTNNLGTAQISFSLPAESFGSRELRVTAETGLGRVVASEPVQLERRDRILLTTDKPIYQPGQTMHLRALALDGPSRAAAANQPVMLEIEDGKGNKVFKQRGTTDRFGIASADFELADEVNFGPYHVRAILGNDGAQSVQEKTVTVDRYVLPKFKIAIEMDGDKAKQQMSYYRPGETVSGKVTAQYLFGKPIVNADVALTLTTFDVQSVELGRLTGKTDADGRFAFSSKLPDFLAGRSTEQGSAPVSIAAEIKDTASHTESKTRNILVSNAPILIMAVPESGRLLPGLENRVYILTSYPDGTPAETELSGNIKASPLKTDASGVATISIEGGVGDAAPVLEIIATDSQGRSARASIKLESQTGSQSLMLRTDKTVFKIGDRLNLATISTRRQGPVYVDVIKDGQTLVTRAIDTADGRGELSLNLTEAMFGTLEVRAYQITAGDAEPVMDRRLIYVDPADDLKVDVSTD